jgi:hypothetical protein
MDTVTARQILRVAFRTSAELQELLMFVKERCSREEYAQYALGIAAATDAIGTGLISKATSAHPELTDEIEAEIARHGRYTNELP